MGVPTRVADESRICRNDTVPLASWNLGPVSIFRGAYGIDPRLCRDPLRPQSFLDLPGLLEDLPACFPFTGPHLLRGLRPVERSVPARLRAPEDTDRPSHPPKPSHRTDWVRQVAHAAWVGSAPDLNQNFEDPHPRRPKDLDPPLRRPFPLPQSDRTDLVPQRILMGGSCSFL